MMSCVDFALVTFSAVTNVFYLVLGIQKSNTSLNRTYDHEQSRDMSVK